MKYYKIHWNETRGDEYDHWGTSWWFFEVNEELEIIRQLSLFENNKLLLYSNSHLDDQYGGLSTCNFNEFDEGIEIIEITKSDFENTIKNGNQINN